MCDELFSNLQILSHSQIAARPSLLHLYSYSKCFKELDSLDPLVQTFTTRTRHAMFTVTSHRHSIIVTIVRSSTETVSPRNCYFVEQTPGRMLAWPLQSWSLHPYSQPISILHLVIIYTFYFLSKNLTKHNSTLRLTFGPCI